MSRRPARGIREELPQAEGLVVHRRPGWAREGARVARAAEEPGEDRAGPLRLETDTGRTRFHPPLHPGASSRGGGQETVSHYALLHARQSGCVLLTEDDIGRQTAARVSSIAAMSAEFSNSGPPRLVGRRSDAATTARRQEQAKRSPATQRNSSAGRTRTVHSGSKQPGADRRRAPCPAAEHLEGAAAALLPARRAALTPGRFARRDARHARVPSRAPLHGSSRPCARGAIR